MLAQAPTLVLVLELEQGQVPMVMITSLALYHQLVEVVALL